MVLKVERGTLPCLVGGKLWLCRKEGLSGQGRKVTERELFY